MAYKKRWLIGDVTGLTSALSGKIPASEKGANSGVATLDSGGKLTATQIPGSLVSGLNYKGVLDASDEEYPATPASGDYYIISVAGIIDSVDFQIGDWATYSTSGGWDKIDNTDKVASVCSKTGTVTLEPSDITGLVTALSGKEPTVSKGNISETTSSVLTVSGGTGAIIGTGVTIAVSASSSTTPGYLSAADWTTFNGKQASITPAGLSEATSSVLTISTGGATALLTAATIEVKAASGSQGGYLSSTDWTTFNGKQSALTISTGLTNTTGTVTVDLATGKSGGQSITGGTASGDDLSITSTSNATKGTVSIQPDGGDTVFGGAIGYKHAAVTGETTLGASHHVVLADASSASFVIYLPAAASCAGRVYQIKKVNSDEAKTVTVDPNSTETIDGETTLVLSVQYEGYPIMSDGTNWVIL